MSPSTGAVCHADRLMLSVVPVAWVVMVQVLVVAVCTERSNLKSGS